MRGHGVLLHTDAAQSLGKVPVDVNELGVDLLTVAGHKLYAPKGIGVLYVRHGVKLEPFIHGAGHESAAVRRDRECALSRGPGHCESRPAVARRGDRAAAGNAARSALERLRSALGERVVLNGHPEQRLPNTLNVNFVGQRGA